MNKFLQTIYHFLGLKPFHNYRISHPQPNGQAERYSKTPITRFGHYVAEPQRNWSILVQPPTYTYNTQVNRSNRTTLFKLLLSRHQPDPTNFDYPSALPTDATSAITPAVIRPKVPPFHCRDAYRDLISELPCNADVTIIMTHTIFRLGIDRHAVVEIHIREKDKCFTPIRVPGGISLRILCDRFANRY